MKVTARAEYASLAILELALRKNARQIQAKEIAERRSIPLKFLEQILIQLRNAGLVKSVRGAAGGYFLAKRADQITLRDVVEAVEGEMKLLDGNLEDQTMVSVWEEIEDEFLSRLESISFQQVVNRKLKERNIPTFQI